MRLLFLLLLIVAGCRADLPGEDLALMELTTVPTAPPTITATPHITTTMTTATLIPDRQVEVIFQSFETGFMLWDIEKQCAYAYREGNEAGIIIPDSLDKEYSPGNRYTYCLPEPETIPPAIEYRSAENGHVPSGKLGSIWRAYPEVRSAIGYAMGEEAHYVAHVPYEGTAISLVCCNVAALPDGRILQCGFYAHSSGTCDLSTRVTRQ